MKGHIRERSPGRWAVIVDMRDPETGKRRRKWHSFAGTKRQAQIECARLVSELSGGAYIEPSRTTLAVYLDRWLEHVKTQVSPRTHERYAELVHKNIAPVLGSATLSKLQPAQISMAYAKALKSGRRDGKGGLSARTVHHMHRILRQALQQAVRWQILARNPTDAVQAPKVERTRMRSLDLNETAIVLDAMRESRMFVPVLLGVLCGLRRGEIAALRWRAIDLVRGELAVAASVEQTSKCIREKETKSGRARTVAMPSLVVEELRRHRARQTEELLRLGMRQGEDGHVVTRADGAPLQPRTLTHEWTRLFAKTGLPRIRLHDLRHSHATHMLAAGVHPKIAQERLGHSNISITLDLYSHVMPGMQEDAASRVDATMRAALERRREKKG